MSHRLTEDGTLTLEDRPLSVPMAKERVLGILGRVEARLGLKIRAFIVFETHQSGWPHAHCLLALQQDRETMALAELRLEWNRTQGLCFVQRVYSASGILRYLAKDLAQGGSDFEFWRMPRDSERIEPLG